MSDVHRPELCWPRFVMSPERDASPVAASRPESATDAPARPLAAEDDRSLVAACLAGERQAFDVLVERHRRSVYHVCFRFTGNHADASDLAQDTFVRAYRALGRFRGEAAVSTWLYRIAVNVCLNRAAVKTPAFDAMDPADEPEAPSERADLALARSEQAGLVKAAIAQLPEKQRATVILRVYHELPHEEIARVLGTSVGTAKANFFHALRNLRRLLGTGGVR